MKRGPIRMIVNSVGPRKKTKHIDRWTGKLRLMQKVLGIIKKICLFQVFLPFVNIRIQTDGQISLDRCKKLLV